MRVLPFLLAAAFAATAAAQPRVAFSVDLPLPVSGHYEHAAATVHADGTGAPAAGFAQMSESYESTQPGTRFFGATPSGRRVRQGTTGERTVTRRPDGGSPVQAACAWGDALALLTADGAGPYPARTLGVRLVTVAASRTFDASGGLAADHDPAVTVHDLVR